MRFTATDGGPAEPLASAGRRIAIWLAAAVLASWFSSAWAGSLKVDDLPIPQFQRLVCGTLVGLGLAGAAIGFLKAWLAARRQPPSGLLPLALIMHAICFAALPCTSNDIFANLTFGREVLVGLNPFHDVAADLGADPIVPYMGSTWMHWHTCYGPLTTMIDALAAWPSGIVVPLLLFKLLMLGCSLAAVLLAHDFCRSCLSPKHAAQAFILLAWNPLLAWEVSGQAHNDGLLMLALTAFVWASARKRQWLAAAALMAGCYLKFAALPVIGLYGLCVGRQRLGRSLLMGLALVAVGVLLYAPFWRGTATLAPALLASTASLDYVSNSLAAVIVGAAKLVDPQSAPTLFGMVLLASRSVCLVLALVFALRARCVTRVVQDGLIFLLVFECLGMGWFQPWYATWLLPLAVACRSARLQSIVVLYTATVWVVYLPYDGFYVLLIAAHAFPVVMLVRLWLVRRTVKSSSFGFAAPGGVAYEPKLLLHREANLMQSPRRAPLISLVVPVYQNAASLADLHERLRQVTAGRSDARWEFVFVDDGSTDRSLAVLEELQRSDGRIRIVRLSRNFGSQAAIVAGLSQARGGAMAVIAADLQDPPEILVPLVAAWQQGAKAVLAVRSRRDDPWPARLGAALFYAIFRRLALAGMPAGGFDCCLLDRQLAERLVALRRPCYLAGEIIWLGFEPVLISYHRGKRLARYGRTMWTLGKRMRLAVDAIWTFSRAPLRIVQALGLLLNLLAVAGALLALFAFSPAHRDRNLLLAAIAGFSGLQLLATSWVGSSVWACQQSQLNRPPFVIDRLIEADAQDRHAA